MTQISRPRLQTPQLMDYLFHKDFYWTKVIRWIEKGIFWASKELSLKIWSMDPAWWLKGRTYLGLYTEK